MEKIEINVSNKLFYSVITLIAIILVGVGVYAYGGTAPATMGHTLGELIPSCGGMIKGTSGVANSWSCTPNPPTCSGTNQVLQWTGTSWSCVVVDIGYECAWVGWSPSFPTYPSPSTNPCYIEDTCEIESSCYTGVCPCWDGGLQITPPGEWPYYAGVIQQRYCSGGSITDERYVSLCASDIDEYCHYSIIEPY
jgi:hypothetical protein